MQNTHKFFAQLMDKVPLIHPNLKRLQWGRALNHATDNITCLVSQLLVPHHKDT